MPDNINVLSLWISEVKIELKERRDENVQQRIDFEKLKTEVGTRNKIIWLLVGFLLTATAIIVTIAVAG